MTEKLLLIVFFLGLSFGGSLLHGGLGRLLGLLGLAAAALSSRVPTEPMADFRNSMRTRSSLVSMTTVRSVMATMRPYTPPMVVSQSPFCRELRISSACFFRLLSGRMSMK